MKAFEEYTNEDKAKLIHALFPKEMPDLLDYITAYCKDLEERKEEYAKKWDDGFMHFNYWLNLAQETERLIKRHRFDLIRSRIVFSSQLCYTYTVLVLNECIVRYAETKSSNEKFKKAVSFLYT